MRVLVTGGGGFLGRRVVQALGRSGHDAIAAGHDTEHPTEFRLLEQVEDLFAEVRPEAVIHLAGTARREDFARGPAEVRTENVSHPLLNVLELAGRRRVVAVSSAQVWGDGPLGDAATPSPRDLYAAARASAEVMGTRRAQGDFLLVRPFLLVGEGAPVCELFDPRSVWHAEDTEVDVTDVDDAAAALVQVLEAGGGGRSFTLASGHTRPLAELLAAGRLRAPRPPAAAGAARRWSAPPDALMALGWAPDRSVRQAASMETPGSRTLVGRGD